MYGNQRLEFYQCNFLRNSELFIKWTTDRIVWIIICANKFGKILVPVPPIKNNFFTFFFFTFCKEFFLVDDDSRLSAFGLVS
jgi:hypothetical protein